jgi:hypothetical protein
MSTTTPVTANAAGMLFSKMTEARRKRLILSPTLAKLALSSSNINNLDSRTIFRIKEVVEGTIWDDSVYSSLKDFPNIPGGAPVGTAHAVFWLTKPDFESFCCDQALTPTAICAAIASQKKGLPSHVLLVHPEILDH